MKRFYFVVTNAYNMVISDDGETRRVISNGSIPQGGISAKDAKAFLKTIEDDSSWEEFTETVEELAAESEIISVLQDDEESRNEGSIFKRAYDFVDDDGKTVKYFYNGVFHDGDSEYAVYEVECGYCDYGYTEVLVVSPDGKKSFHKLRVYHKQWARKRDGSLKNAHGDYVNIPLSGGRRHRYYISDFA